MAAVTLEQCNELMKKYEEYKKTAEQHMFPLLFILDSKLIPAHRDLNRNWSQEHGEVFVRNMKNTVFPKLGIKEDK